jgi:hypothetical protein
MHQFQFLQFGMGGAERFDHTGTQSAAPVNGNARRLINDNEVAVFVNDRAGDEFA